MREIPYKSYIIWLMRRRSRRGKGMNSALLVQITTLYKPNKIMLG